MDRPTDSNHTIDHSGDQFVQETTELVESTRLLSVITGPNAYLNLVPLAREGKIPQDLDEDANKKLLRVEQELFDWRPNDYLVYAKLTPHRPHTEIITNVLTEEWNEFLCQLELYESATTRGKRPLSAGLQTCAQRIKVRLETAAEIGIHLADQMARLEKISGIKGFPKI